MINPKNPDFTNTPISPKRPGFGYKLADLSVTPYVTIITPFYNTGPVFHETGQSVFQQSFQQWEWLIINDGSSDSESLSILDSYRDRDPRIMVIDHDTNKGLSAARNTGFRAAKSNYIVQIDSDDLLEPTAVEKWLWFLESNPEYSFCKGYSIGFGAKQYLWNKGFHGSREFLKSNLVNPTAAIRKNIHEKVGGYDENDFSGLMDWDFWLRCASFGYWGGTVSEYLDWYRRRETHSDRWPDFDEGSRQKAYGTKLRKKYESLWNGKFPQIITKKNAFNENTVDKMPFENHLIKEKKRLLMIVAWLDYGGADKFNLDLINQLKNREWEITIVTTLKGYNSWYHYFAGHTPDIFILSNFLGYYDYPRFIQYIICSRQIDLVLISHSELGYALLPYLSSHFSNVNFVDFCHLEELNWNNGGYARMSVDYQELIDLNIVSSVHLKNWMIQQGSDPNKIEVCYTNIDPNYWKPDPNLRSKVRKDLGLEDRVPVLLYTGRIWPQKQPRIFAHSVLRLHQKGINFVALIAGDGPEFYWLRRFINKHKLNKKAILLGEVSNQCINHLMKAADILFLPSQWEGISLSIYEAMSSGLPIVGADVGGQKELVTPECGVLIPRCDEDTEVELYSETLERLIKNPDLSKEMGQAARNRVKTYFHIEIMGEKISSLFENSLAHISKQPRPIPDIEMGRTSVVKAIQQTYTYHWETKTWDSLRNPRRKKLYIFLKGALEPLYLWCLKRGWTWLTPLSEKVKDMLLS